MKVRLTLLLALVLLAVPWQASAQQFVFSETFDAFAGERTRAFPWIGELASDTWRFKPNHGNGTFPFPPQEPTPRSRLREEGLRVGFGVIPQKPGWALGLFAKNGERASATLCKPIEANWGTREAFLAYRIVTPSSAEGDRALGQATVSLDYTLDGRTWSSLPEGTVLTSGSNEHAAEVMLNIPFGKANPSRLCVSWTVQSRTETLVGLDDVVVAPRRPKVIVVAHVDGPVDEARFLKEALRREIIEHDFGVVTCEEDIEQQLKTEKNLDAQHIASRDDSPNRYTLWQKMVAAGCKSPFGAELHTAWLTPHTDPRTGRRSLVLRLRNLDSESPSPLFGSISEPADERWTWGTLIARVLERSLAADGGDSRPSVAVGPPVDLEVGWTVRVAPKLTGGPSKGAVEARRRNAAATWSIYRCLDRATCEQFVTTVNEYQRCKDAERNHAVSDPAPPTICVPPQAYAERMTLLGGFTCDNQPKPSGIAVAASAAYNGGEVTASPAPQACSLGYDPTLRFDREGNYVVRITVKNDHDEATAARPIAARMHPYSVRGGLGVMRVNDGADHAWGKARQVTHLSLYRYLDPWLYHVAVGGEGVLLWAGDQDLVGGLMGSVLFHRGLFGDVSGEAALSAGVWSPGGKSDAAFAAGISIKLGYASSTSNTFSLRPGLLTSGLLTTNSPKLFPFVSFEWARNW